MPTGGLRRPHRSPERGDVGPADLPPLRVDAARVERAARRRADQARRLARDRLEPLLVHVDPRKAVHEPDRVRMPRIVEDRVDVADLDDTARVHDDDAIGELSDKAEVVRDEDDRGLRVLLGGLDHLDDLGLDRHVERRRRLVGDRARSGSSPWPWRSSRAAACRPRTRAGTD